jgi:DNA topoisomerase-3
MAGVQVLMVAEKPSLAHSIARLLASGEVESRRGTLDVHEWTGQFKGRAARFRMTSVMGACVVERLCGSVEVCTMMRAKAC